LNISKSSKKELEERALAMKIGFIGLGMMGKPMALRLLGKGFSLHVHNRTREKAKELLEKGAQWNENPRQLMAESEIVISMVADSTALENITVGNEGTLDMAAGRVHIDMSTVSPMTTKKLEQAYRGKHGAFLHAPVLGSVPQVTEGSLLVFVGGDPVTARRCESIFTSLGRRVWYFNEVTKATHLKLICNLFIASMMTALSEGLVLGQKVGLSSHTILEVLKDSALAAPMYQTKGEAIRRRDFTARFMVSHMEKDANLILEAAHAAGVLLPAVEAVRQLYSDATLLGLGKEDYSGVIKVLERSAGVEVKS
jgi:3-hydroxyisobutyrate dehydrogenase-like beta-hydroxyacid dehydrogenase